MNSKDINDPIINMILAEGKWDVANVKISDDAERYYVETFIKLDEELDQELSRLDESVTEDDVVEELLEELETLAEKEDLSDDEYIFANVLESRLDEILGRLLRGVGDMARGGITGVKNVADKARAFYKRGMGDRLGAARVERGIEVRKGAEDIRKKRRALSDREEAGIKKHGGYGGGFRSFMRSPEGQRLKAERSRLTNRALGGDSMASVIQRRKQNPGMSYDEALAQASGSRGRASVSRARGRTATYMPSHDNVETYKHQITGKDTVLRRGDRVRGDKLRSSKVKKGAFGRGQSNPAAKAAAARAAAAEEAAKKPKTVKSGKKSGGSKRRPPPTAKGKKAPPPPTAKGKKAKGELSHTEYQGEGFTLAEAIIHNVKNRLL